MSTMHGPARARTPRPLPSRRLDLVPRPAPVTSRTPFIAVMVLLVGAGVIGLLVLNTALQSRAFALSDLQQNAGDLRAREAALQMQVDHASSPDRIAARAAVLGMVPNTNPVFLRLGDGRVIGDPVPAVAGTNLTGLPTPGSQDPAGTGREPTRAAEHSSEEKAAQGAKAAKNSSSAKKPDQDTKAAHDGNTAKKPAHPGGRLTARSGPGADGRSARHGGGVRHGGQGGSR